MKPERKMSRRRFLIGAAAAGAAGVLAACQPKTVVVEKEVEKPVEKVVKETVVVEKEVEKVVKETIVVEKEVEKVITATPAPKGAYEELEGTLAIAKYVDAPNADGSKSVGQLVWEKILAAYKEVQPGVEIEEIYFPQGAMPDEVYQWVKTRQAAREVPTIVNSTVDEWFSPALERAGKAPWVAVDSYLQEVNPYTGNIWVDDQDYNLIRWRSAINDRTHIYGIATTKYKAAWMYNKTIFDELGLTEPKTYSEWFALNDTLKENGVIPLAEFGGAFRWSHFTWILFGCLGRTDWNAFAGAGRDFPTLDRKLEWALCDKWRQDRPWVHEGYDVLKKFSTYCTEGFLGMDPGQTIELFMQGKATQLYVDQGYLKVIDSAREDGQFEWEISAFPTPTPDVGLFSQGVIDNMGPMADDGENFGAWVIAGAHVRKDKEENQVKMAVDFFRFLTSPQVQEMYVNDLLNLPVNPNVEPKDPRIAAWLKNPEQIEYKFFFFGDRPTWYQYFEGYLTDQLTVDELIASSEQEIKQWAETQAKEAQITVTCE
jgi:ABC-type glycerol-3-phosphate transport system substrate-binding protein